MPVALAIRGSRGADARVAAPTMKLRRSMLSDGTDVVEWPSTGQKPLLDRVVLPETRLAMQDCAGGVRRKQPVFVKSHLATALKTPLDQVKETCQYRRTHPTRQSE